VPAHAPHRGVIARPARGLLADPWRDAGLHRFFNHFMRPTAITVYLLRGGGATADLAEAERFGVARVFRAGVEHSVSEVEAAALRRDGFAAGLRWSWRRGS
jgi:hypothetical protein